MSSKTQPFRQFFRCIWYKNSIDKTHYRHLHIPQFLVSNLIYIVVNLFYTIIFILFLKNNCIIYDFGELFVAVMCINW